MKTKLCRFVYCSDLVFSRKMIAGKYMPDITVGDSGKGLTDEQVTSFHKGKDIARSKGSAGKQSFGIGLAHIRQLVDKQNETITLKSKLNFVNRSATVNLHY